MCLLSQVAAAPQVELVSTCGAFEPLKHHSHLPSTLKDMSTVVAIVLVSSILTSMVVIVAEEFVVIAGLPRTVMFDATLIASNRKIFRETKGWLHHSDNDNEKL